jgi:hypothetical protein
MKNRASRMIRIAPHVLACFATLAACEGSVDGDESVAPEASAQTHGLLATLRLTDTHVVEFYESSPGNGMVSEDYDVDKDEGVVRSLQLANGELLPAYRQLAGNKASAEALSNLEAYEARRRAFVPGNDGEEERPALVGKPANVVVAPGPVQKDRTSDAYWFAGRYCNYAAAPDGCLGDRGARFPWLPTDRPVCTNVVELCGTGFGDPFRDDAVKSNNMRWAAYNQASSGPNLRAVYYFIDPCENDSWWDRTFTLCTKGGLGNEFAVEPRHARESTSTSSVGWTRQVEITGNSPIGAKVNTY